MAPSRSPETTSDNGAVNSKVATFIGTPSSQLDATLQHFADPSFDPVDYLNNTLPSLAISTFPSTVSTSSQSQASKAANPVPLSDLSTQTQSLLSQLSAHNVRLSNALTQLTDEILRSGGRLAYEVEVLRGETIGLSDTLTDVLRPDIQRFVPDAADEPTEKVLKDAPKEAEEPSDRPDEKDDYDPEYIKQLRMLNQVRSKLESVIQTFGDAMEWTIPPSETSITSSFISVSAPEPGPESHSREERGREVSKKLRAEVTELLDSNGGGEAGLEAADARVESLRELATVWKGTAEEKARNKFVESLARLVEDRRKLLATQLRERELAEQAPRKTKGMPLLDQVREERSNTSDSGGGLLRNLQRLRDEIYLD